VVTDIVRRRIEALQTRYIRIIDDNRIEDWPKLFTPTCLYRIVTRENHSQGLPLSVMECRSRGMMEDRVTGLRRINVYEPQRYTHQISALEIKDEIEAESETRFKCRSNYLVVRTSSDGSMTVFSTGVYLDTVVVEGDIALFEERIVVQESRRVDTLMVIPL
jgi:anthranilate 1,2-dioxygenase small subunit